MWSVIITKVIPNCISVYVITYNVFSLNSYIYKVMLKDKVDLLDAVMIQNGE